METPELHYIDKLAGDDSAFRLQFITILKEEFPVEKKEYLQHMQEGAIIKASEIVHKIKHKFNILSMENAYRLAVTHEKDLIAGIAEKNLSFELTLQTVEEFLKNL